MSDGDELAVLLDHLESAVAPSTEPLWIRVDDPAGSERSVRLQSHPATLTGWRAPATCRILGVVAGAWARPWPGPDPTERHPAVQPPAAVPGRARITYLVDRHGRMAARTTLSDGERLDDPPTGGRLVDTLLRCFGLPTAPPPVSSNHLLAVLWLGSALAAGSGAPDDWDRVVGAHPAVQTLAALGEPVCADDLPTVVRAAGRAWTWSSLRRLCAEGTTLTEVVEPRIADWADDGFFARVVLDSLRSLEELTAEGRVVLGSELIDRLLHVAGVTDGPVPGIGYHMPRDRPPAARR